MPFDCEDIIFKVEIEWLISSQSHSGHKGTSNSVRNERENDRLQVVRRLRKTKTKRKMVREEKGSESIYMSTWNSKPATNSHETSLIKEGGPIRL